MSFGPVKVHKLNNSILDKTSSQHTGGVCVGTRPSETWKGKGQTTNKYYPTSFYPTQLRLGLQPDRS